MSAFSQPSLLKQLLASPLLFLLRRLYALLRLLRSPPLTRSSSQLPVRVVCISDTHTRRLSSVADGDLLIHAGDLTDAGTLADIQDAIDWLKSLPHRHKVVVAGNHDSWFDENVRPLVRSIHHEDENEDGELDWGDIHYLQNSTITLSFPSLSSSSSGRSPRTLTIHGAPQLPQFDPSHPSLNAFQYPLSITPESTKIPWPAPIPPSTDILVSHSPPLHHHDNFPHAVGCPHLLAAAWRVRPLLHVFGHAHASRGVERVYYDNSQRVFEGLCASRVEEGPIWTQGRGLGYWIFTRGAGLRDLCDWRMWRGVVRVICGAMKAVLWTRVWGGEGGLGREGWMVNAACLDDRTKKLRGKGIVVDI